MIAFTRIPSAGAPLGAPVRYAFACDEPGDVRFRLLTPEGRLLAAKRFREVSEADFDVALYLRRAPLFTPSAGGTGPRAATGRTVEAYAEVTLVPASGAAEQSAVAPLRRFLPCALPPSLPALLGPMPAERLIAPGERDELTLLAEAPCTLRLTARTARAAAVGEYPVPAGLSLFSVDTADFPDADRIEIDIGGWGRVAYTLAAQPDDAVRLAWRTVEGSVEHYTFPTLLRLGVGALRRRTEGAEGALPSGGRGVRSATLVSACEPPAVAEALAGLLVSPAVWRVGSGGCEPVEVLSQEAVIARHGLLSTVELTIRPTLHTPVPWNC